MKGICSAKIRIDFQNVPILILGNCATSLEQPFTAKQMGLRCIFLANIFIERATGIRTEDITV